MINRIWNIKRKAGGATTFYVDAANPVIWAALKREFGEREDAEYVRTELSRIKSENGNPANYMMIVPIPFSTMHKEMLSHTKDMIESGLVQISPTFDKLLTALRTAVADEDSLNKEETSYR